MGDGGGTTRGLAGAAAREPVDENAAQAALFERILERVYRYFRKTVRDPHEAEDCVQRTLADRWCRERYQCDHRVRGGRRGRRTRPEDGRCAPSGGPRSESTGCSGRS
jgi:hypothetical protein